MAIFKVAGKNGPALCKRCYRELQDGFMRSGCGRPLAVCPSCKVLYILYCIPFTGDGLIDYCWYRSFPERFVWEWMRLDKYCLKRSA